MEKEESAPEFDPFAEDKMPAPAKSGGGRMLSGLALLVALAVAGWNGWSWWQARQATDTTAELQQAMAELRSAQAALQRSQEQQGRRVDAVERLELGAGLAALDQAVERAESVAGSDRARLEGLESELGETGERLDAVEGRLAAVVVRGESPRQGLDLAEVDYLLRSANERLRLYDDARTADQALALADEQLAALDDPVYLSVRQSIAGARLSLASVEAPDSIALTESLGQLQGRIAVLPFPGEMVIATSDGALETVEDPGAWARFTAAVGGLVSVRRQAEDVSLVSLEDKDYVRQGLWLQLESARLALLRADDTGWQAALDRADATVEQYFAAEAAEVRRFTEDLAVARGTSLAVTWPDISEPWTRLQGIRSVDSAPPANDTPSPADESASPLEEAADAADEAGPVANNVARAADEDISTAIEPAPAAEDATQAADDDGGS